MKKINILFVCLVFGIVLQENAIADTKTYNKPTKGGIEYDATVWEWDGKTPESEASQKAADLLCQYLRNDRAIDYEIGKGPSKGTWRFHKNGKLEKCGFCQWYIKKVTCEY